MKTFVSVLLMIGLAGCAMAAPVPAPPPAPGNVGGILQSSLVLGQPRRLPDAEAGAATATASEASPAGDLARVEAALKAQASEGGPADVMVFGRNRDGWRCGRVQFANRGGGFILFAVRLAPDPVETRLGRDPASLAQVRSICGG